MRSGRIRYQSSEGLSDSARFANLIRGGVEMTGEWDGTENSDPGPSGGSGGGFNPLVFLLKWAGFSLLFYILLWTILQVGAWLLTWGNFNLISSIEGTDQYNWWSVGVGVFSLILGFSSAVDSD